MDDHRKTATITASDIVDLTCVKDDWTINEIVPIIEKSLRTTASKSEKDVWNKAVEECAKIVERGHITIDGVSHPFRLDDIALTLRRLIREEK